MEELQALYLYITLFTLTWFFVVYIFYISCKDEQDTSSAEFCRQLLWFTPLASILIPMAVALGIAGGLLYMCFVYIPDWINQDRKESLAEWTLKQEVKKANEGYHKSTPLVTAKKRETIPPVKPREVKTENGKKPSFKEAFKQDDE